MRSHFVMMAEYNAWANARVYGMARALTDDQYRRDVGVYFKSLHATLNHILTADLIWLRRLTGTGEHPTQLNAIVFDDLPSLWAARQREDQRLIDFVGALSDVQFDEPTEYRMMSGAAITQPRREVLAHVFNHQTHHRGQAHAILTLLGKAEPEPLDLLIMQLQRA